MKLKEVYLKHIKKVKEIEAKNFDEAYNKAKIEGLKDFLWNGKHYSTKYDGSSEEERSLYGVSNARETAGEKIPQGEDPIRIFIYPFGGDNMGLTSHAALEYKNKAISYGSAGNDDNVDFTWSSETCRVYEIYPSMIKDFEIDTEKLEELIKERQKKSGDDYKFLRDNCADQCIKVLEGAGAKGIVQPAGIAIPQVLEIWAKKYGHEISQNQVVDNSVQMHQEFVNNIKALQLKKDPKLYEHISKAYKQDRLKHAIEGIKGKNIGPTRWYQLSKKSEDELCERIKEDFRKTRNNPKQTKEMIDYINRLQTEDMIDLSVLIEKGLNEEIKKSALYQQKGDEVLVVDYYSYPRDDEQSAVAQNSLGDVYAKMLQKHHQMLDAEYQRTKLDATHAQNETQQRVSRLLRNQQYKENQMNINDENSRA